MEFLKKHLLQLTDVHQIFVTYWFARNFRTQKSPLNPTILLALSAATLNMDVSLAHTLIMKEQTTHHFNNTGEVREIKQQMTCKSTNLIYMIECKRCKKQKKKKRTLRERFTEHRQATNNPSHANASTAVPTHFNLPDHSIEDMTLIPLELQPTRNTSRRKARETYLMHRGETLEPSGMKRRNER